MRYYSLNDPEVTRSFSAAVIQSQALDGGLFSPENIPHGFTLPPLDAQTSPQSLAAQLLEPMLSPDISRSSLRKICEETFQFPIPLKQLSPHLWVLELFHGPTAAFKDVGARFLSRTLSALSHQPLTIIVATSGDTGGAVAHGFYGVEGIDVVILYPKGRVSPLQESQLTGLGGNITALEVDGSFDDCQRMAKAMLADADLRKKRPLSSANSINIARWLPQSVYYAWAAQQLRLQSHRAGSLEEIAPLYVIPSGNLGNLAAGLFAWRRGLRTAGFIAATNRNDSFTRFVHTGDFYPQCSTLTPSNAMDVGDPSNRSRVEALFNHDRNQLSNHLYSYSVSDEATLNTIRRVYEERGYLLCPHSAVGYEAYQQHLSFGIHPPQQPTILLATAHPAKFTEVVTPVIGEPPPLPPSLSQLNAQVETGNKLSLQADSAVLRDYLLATAPHSV